MEPNDFNRLTIRPIDPEVEKQLPTPIYVVKFPLVKIKQSLYSILYHRSIKILRFMMGHLCAPRLECIREFKKPRRDAEDNVD